MVDVQLSTADKGIMMIDRYTKFLLTVIAINLTIIVGHGALKVAVPGAIAQNVVPVRVVQGQAAHEVEVYCTNC